jgi:hypothetical protein
MIFNYSERLFTEFPTKQAIIKPEDLKKNFFWGGEVVGLFLILFFGTSNNILLKY